MITSLGKRAVRRALDYRARRFRRLPELRMGSGPGTSVYYLCPDYQTPSGGVRVIYRHVDLLNAAGVNAAVLHSRSGFSCSWFQHATRVRGADEVRLSPGDVLVVPEIYGPSLRDLPEGLRVVVFNQNAYMTFDGLTEEQVAAGGPYRGVPGLSALLAVSADNADYLRLAFPELPVSTVANAIDPAVFHPGEPFDRSKRIALMPRKRPRDAAQVLHLLRTHASLDGWEVVPIAGVPERQTAEVMRSSPIFLAFGHQEGFGLPAAEAMASGCYVIGFTGMAGREFLLPEYAHPVEDGDVQAFARAVAEVAELYEKDPATVRETGRRAAAHIHRTYSPERQWVELSAFFQELTG